MTIKLPLRVFKTRPYAWRTNLGGAHHGSLDAWNVEDAQGTYLAGGLADAGSNVRTARPEFRLKREALAYVAGYSTFLEGKFAPAELCQTGLGFEYMALRKRQGFPSAQAIGKSGRRIGSSLGLFHEYSVPPLRSK